MARLRRPLAAFLVVAGASAALALLLAHASANKPSAAVRPAVTRLTHESVLEHQLGGADATEGGDSEAYTDRAYPGTEITLAEVQGAIRANAKLQKKGPKGSDKWEQIGPDTLDVDRLGTQSFIKPTQWSGRVTAVTVSPKCNEEECPLYVGAAGGGVWLSHDALGDKPHWKQISADIPTNAIGSIAVDPNDPKGKTVYVGTGEGNGSGDSEAGLGLYKSTDEGHNWTLVPGSFAAANNRSITWIAIEPGNANHILIGTRTGTHGEASNSTAAQPATLPAPPATGVWASTDGGANFSLVLPGLVNEVKFDPGNSSTVYATVANSATGGLLRSTSGGALGTWTPILQENRVRLSFAPVLLPNGKTRIYVADASGGGQGAQVYRVDDASQPAETLTASNNAAWTRLSNPTDGTPGFAVYNYCNTPLVGSQCVYDMFVLSPPDRPDMVVVGGLMHYEELMPYVFQTANVVGMRSNGRSVLMSMDAGSTWTDVTGDVGGESMHPDQHAIAFVPGDPDKFFVGSDGGMIRTSGEWADASSQCDSRNLFGNPLFIADCHAWLSQIPTELQVINASLATLQMNSISVSPYKPENTAMTGTQDNGTLSFTGSKKWFLPLTGDGGNSGFDATDQHLRFHTYTGGQMDVNYNDADPTSWLFIGDRFLVNFPEAQRFYAAVISDPVRTKTIFHGAQSVWRTSNAGGDRAFLEQHCNVASIIGEDPDNLLFTGACGDVASWPKLGTSTLTNNTATSPYGTTKGGSTISSLARAQDDGTMWAATGAGRVLVSRNINSDDPTAVTFTRIDTAAQPGRAVSSVYADPTNPNHALVTFSGYDVTTPTTPGHIFDVVIDPTTGAATWTDISYDIGDQPVNDAVLDVATGDIYVSSDFSVFRLDSGAQSWAPVAGGLPMAAVSGLTLAKAKHGPQRFLYAATHGRGAYRLRIP
jgi:hypothetical protein